MSSLIEIHKPRWCPPKLWHSMAVFCGIMFTDYLQLALKGELEECSSILELGCGKDSPIAPFARGIRRSVAVDMHCPSLLRNKESHYFDDYVLADIRYPPIRNNSFDCVAALDIIEHLSKPDGYKLMDSMEKIFLKKVLILTPNGSSSKQHIEDGNILQHHLSAWVSDEFLKLGYEVFGINGIRALRSEQAHPTIKPRPIGYLITRLTERIVFHDPSRAFQLLCVKSKNGSNSTEATEVHARSVSSI